MTTLDHKMPDITSLSVGDLLYPTKMWKGNVDKLLTAGKSYEIKESPYSPNVLCINTDIGSIMCLPAQPKLGKLFSTTPVRWDDE